MQVLDSYFLYYKTTEWCWILLLTRHDHVSVRVSPEVDALGEGLGVTLYGELLADVGAL